MQDSPNNERTNRIWTIPNLLCAVRIIGSPFLIALAIFEQRNEFVGLFVFLMLTDWLDGKLAILLRQRSTIGAKIDTWADATMYACLLVGGGWLCRNSLGSDVYLIAVIMALYACSISFSLIKFRRWPSYHTRTAKVAWLVVLAGAALFITSGFVWPLRMAMASVTLAIVESIAITILLKSHQVDVPSVFHALPLSKQDAGE